MFNIIVGVILFLIIIAACCSSDNSSTNSNTAPKRNTYNTTRRNTGYYPSSYSECPSCGAPYYDGYCEECGYPDINQGWLGENY